MGDLLVFPTVTPSPWAKVRVQLEAFLDMEGPILITLLYRQCEGLPHERFSHPEVGVIAVSRRFRYGITVTDEGIETRLSFGELGEHDVVVPYEAMLSLCK